MVAERGLEGPVETFQPERTATAEESAQVALRKRFAAARALEDRGLLREARELLEAAVGEGQNDSALLARLCRLNFATGRLDRAVELGRDALERQPNDPATLALMVALLVERRSDPAAAEKLLTSLLANPATDAKGAAALLAHRVLGDLAAELRDQPAEAADHYRAVVEGLDERAATAISQADQKRVLRGDEPESYRRFAAILRESGRFDLAERAARRGLAYAPDDPGLSLSLAEALLAQGRNEEALRIVEASTARPDSDAEGYALLGRVLAALDRKDEYLPRVEKAVAASPSDPSLKFLLVDALRASGQVERADAMLSELARERKDPRTLAPLAGSLLRARKVSEFVDLLDEALKQPGALGVVAAQVEALAADKPLAREAIEAGTRRLADPNGPGLGEPARKVLAYVAGKAGDMEALIALSRAAAARTPSAANLRELAVDLFRAGKHAESAGSVEKLIEQFPRERTAATLGILARSRFLAGQITPALQAAEEARKLDPDDRENLFLVGFLLSRLGKHDEAIAFYEDLLKRFPSDEEIEQRARSGLSVVYVDRGDFDEGARQLRMLLEQEPDDPGVNNDLGYLYADRGERLAEAEAMIRKAVDSEPDNASFLDSLGWVLFKQGRVEEALGPLEQATRDPNASATNFDHLGDVYYRMGRIDDAARCWHRAAEQAGKADPPDKLLKTVQAKLAELEALRATTAAPPAPDPAKPPSP